MIDGKKVLEALRERWKSGETQVSIAKSAGISHAHVCELFSGKADVDGLTIKTLNKLFPEATLDLRGDTVSIHADYNSGNVVGVNRGKISSDCAAAVMNKILNSEILSDVEKVKVLKVLNDER